MKTGQELRREELVSERLLAEHLPVLVAELLADHVWRVRVARPWASRGRGRQLGQVPAELLERAARDLVLEEAAGLEPAAPGVYVGAIVERAAGLLAGAKAGGRTGEGAVRRALMEAARAAGAERKAAGVARLPDVREFTGISTGTFGGEAA